MGIFKRGDGKLVLRILDKISVYYNKQIFYTMVNVIPNKIGRLSLLDLGMLHGLNKVNMYSFKNLGLNYLKKKVSFKRKRCLNIYFGYDYDHRFKFNEFDVSLYQGTHGDELSIQSDLVWPSLVSTEKKVPYVNIIGYLNFTQELSSRPFGARNDWII